MTGHVNNQGMTKIKSWVVQDWNNRIFRLKLGDPILLSELLGKTRKFSIRFRKDEKFFSTILRMLKVVTLEKAPLLYINNQLGCGGGTVGQSVYSTSGKFDVGNQAAIDLSRKTGSDSSPAKRSTTSVSVKGFRR